MIDSTIIDFDNSLHFLFIYVDFRHISLRVAYESVISSNGLYNTWIVVCDVSWHFTQVYWVTINYVIVWTYCPYPDVFISNTHKTKLKRLLTDQFDSFYVEIRNLLKNYCPIWNNFNHLSLQFVQTNYYYVAFIIHQNGLYLFELRTKIKQGLFSNCVPNTYRSINVSCQNFSKSTFVNFCYLFMCLKTNWFHKPWLTRNFVLINNWHRLYCLHF